MVGMDDHHDPLLETNGRYERIQTLGKGSFGFVVQARNSATKEVVAIKLLPRTEVNKYVEAEIVNHSLMRHPHVIQFKEVFLTRQFICIVMEYATGGTLFQYVQKQGRLKEAVARWFFQQLLVGVDYCHKRGVANRDIKLENTLLQVVPRLPLPLVKICDFGYSKAENKSAAKSKVGTLTYMAPEVLINITRDGQYDGKVADIWSCGVMLYVMLCGKYPFDSPNSTGVIATPTDFISMLERMVGRQFTIPADIHASADCQDLLRQMLLPEPHNRITVDGIMAHPWYCTNLPPEASSMNAAYLKTAPPAGVPSPEAIRKLLEEARTGCRAYSWASSHQHTPSLGPRVTPAQPVLAPGAAAPPPAGGMPVAAREPAGNFGAQAEAAARMQQQHQHQQQLVQVQVMHAPILATDAQPQAALGPVMMAVDTYQQHAGMLQQQPPPPVHQQHVLQQQQFMPAGVPLLQLQQLPRPDVPDEVVMMIDAAISDQFRAGQSAASQELRAYFMAATSRVS